MKGIGSDILSIARVQGVIDRSGDRLARRILSPDEHAILDTIDARTLAKAFCAKEAVAKALGTGFRQGVGWQDISIIRNALGAPEVVVRAAAAERLASLGAREVLLTLSDEQDYVVSFAVVQ